MSDDVKDEGAEDEGAEPEVTYPLTFKLAYPVTHGKETIDEITIRRGRNGDMKGITLGSQISADNMALVASRLTGQPLPVILALDADDAGRVNSAVLDFFGRYLGTGRAA